MRLRYSRPLEATDLYTLQDDHSSGAITDKILRRSFNAQSNLLVNASTSGPGIPEARTQSFCL